MPSRLYVSFGLWLLAATVWGVSAPLPVGSQFQVNTYTTASQSFPAVSMDADGDFGVVWESWGSSSGDTWYDSVHARRYAADGAPQASSFQVNTYTPSYQNGVAISLDADGDFVVVWQSDGSSAGDTSDESIQGQRFSAAGVAQGAQFQVNAYTTGAQSVPAVASDPDGDFVVVWRSDGSSGSDTFYGSIQGQRFSATGATSGEQFQVNTYTTQVQSYPAVALSAAGDFAVVWVSIGSSGGDTANWSIQGQRWAAAGTPQGAQFQVNTYTTSYQTSPAIAMQADGDFVVVWDSRGSSGGDTSLYSIQGQRYAADGSPIGGQFQVNSYTTSYQRIPAVGMDVDGDFVVAWQSNGSSGGDTALESIQGQRFSAGGTALGGQFQANTYTSNFQDSPAIALSADGDFVIVWRSWGSSGGDASDGSIQGQRFRVTGELLGRVFFDANANGLQNAGEPGIPGIAVELYDDTLTLRRTAITDLLGEYHLRPKEGSWHLRFRAPPAYFTSPHAGGDDTLDSDAAPATGETPPFPVTINVLDSTLDAGFVVFPLFWDGFEGNSTGAWSLAVP